MAFACTVPSAWLGLPPSPGETNFTFKTQVKCLPLREDFLCFPTLKEPPSLYRKLLSHLPYWPKHTASKDAIESLFPLLGLCLV